MPLPYPLNPLGITGKPYSRRLLYIENTGTQYIQTAIEFDQSLDFTVRARAAIGDHGRSLIIGNYNSRISNQALSLEFTAGDRARGYVSLGVTVDITSSVLQVGTPYDIELRYVRSSGLVEIIVDGVVENSTYLTIGSVSTKQPLRLYNDYRSFGIFTQVKIYDVSVVTTSEIMHLIPVLDMDGIPCFYDKVSGALLYNLGSGDFIYQ